MAMRPACSQCDSSHDRENCPYRWINGDYDEED